MFNMKKLLSDYAEVKERIAVFNKRIRRLKRWSHLFDVIDIPRPEEQYCNCEICTYYRSSAYDAVLLLYEGHDARCKPYIRKTLFTTEFRFADLHGMDDYIRHHFQSGLLVVSTNKDGEIITDFKLSNDIALLEQFNNELLTFERMFVDKLGDIFNSVRIAEYREVRNSLYAVYC